MVRLAAIAISIYILYHLDSCSIWNVKGKKYRNRELKTIGLHGSIDHDID